MEKVLSRLGLSPSSQVPVDAVKTNVAPTLSSADAKKFGLENFCNNCYANSVIQALYFCTPFRDLMLQSTDSSPATTAPQLSPASQLMPLVPNRRKPERKPTPSTSSEPIPPVTPIPSSPPTLFSALRSLFLYISTHPQERGTVSPRAFIEKLKEVNRVFDTTTHQDAHEFLNYLLNKIVEEVEEKRKTDDSSEDCEP
ncbi:putative ubiquitin carboxyl-terminal hydrolase creB [Termitomyces sp. T112]|nr:putative ubiquitin carboxyl-terminal hydrolase creB [Termitomyces sp. T112]